MIALGPIVLLAAVVGAIWYALDRYRGHGPEPHEGRYRGDPTEPDVLAGMSPRTLSLPATLARWQSAGLLTSDQATAIERFELDAETATHAAKPKRRVPVVAEALGYLGGTLGIVGLVLLLTKYWPDIPTSGRVAMGVVGAVAFTAAGFLVPRDDEPALERLRQFVWLTATAAGGLTAGVLAVDVAKVDDAGTVALAIAATIAAHSALLWRNSSRPLQQFTSLVAGLVAAGTFADRLWTNGASGLLVWAVGLALLTAGVWHRTSTPAITVGVAAAGAVVGAAMTAAEWRGPGLLLMTATVGLFLAIAGAAAPLRARDDRIILMVVAGIGALQAVPQTIVWFAEEAGIITGLVMWAIGGTLLALAGRRVIHTPLLAQIAGGLLVVGGAAVTGAQSVAFATVFGMATAVALIGVGTLPDHVLTSIFGSVGLLVNVPWAIRHFFPGEGRVPLLIFVSGMLIVGVAVWFNHIGGRLRHEFHHIARH